MSCDSDYSWGMDKFDSEIEEEVEKCETFFKIDSMIIQKDELARLIKSSDPKDKKELNSLVITIVEENKYNILEYLLDNGYKLEILNSKNQTIVHLAFYKCFGVAERSKYPCFQCSNILSTLIDKELSKDSQNVKNIDSYGLSYLHIACFLGKKDLVVKCLNAGANVNTSFFHVDNYYRNFTALHFAALNTSSSAAEIIDLLLEHGANVEAKDWKGRMPLHLACTAFHGEYGLRCVDTEVDSAKNLVENPQNFDSTNLKIFRTLINKCSMIDARDKSDNTVLLSLFPEKYGEFECLERSWNTNRVPIKETTVKFAILLQSGADLNANNNRKNTVLHLIMDNLQLWRASIRPCNEIGFDDEYHKEMIKELLLRNPEIDINLKNSHRDTPLQLAVENMSHDIVKLLLDNKADLNCLKYNYAYKLFYYPDIVPNLECIRSVIDIIDLFENEGYTLSTEARLKVMEFLVHDKEDCICEFDGDIQDYALFFGSEKHLNKILDAMFDAGISTFSNQDSITTLKEYYNCIIHAELYADKKSFDTLSELVCDCEETFEDFEQSIEIPKEMEAMKEMKLDENVTLHDIMKGHYRHIPQQILDDFDEGIFDEFAYCRNVMKGHFAKSFLRRFVEKNSDFLLKVLYPALPDLCCRLIVDYLSNEDVLNLCSAVNIVNAKEGRLLVK